MKARKFFLNFFILVIFAAVVFFIGWIQFLVKPGTVAIMESKTGGVYEKPIMPGEFVWRWERLLPTNVTLHVFDLSPYEVKKTVSSELPSAAIYRVQLDPSPDFSYRVEMNISLSVSPQKLLSLVKDSQISDQEDLKACLNTKASVVADSVTDSLIKNHSASSVLPSSLSAQELSSLAQSLGSDFSGITVSEVSFASIRIPDYTLYQTAKDSYASYQQKVQELLLDKAAEQAASLAEEDRTMAQLEKFGEVLSRYPALEELAKQGNITEIITVLRSTM